MREEDNWDTHERTLGCFIAVPLQEPLEMLDHGIESAVGVIRGTVQRQPWRALPLRCSPSAGRYAPVWLVAAPTGAESALPFLAAHTVTVGPPETSTLLSFFSTSE